LAFDGKACHAHEVSGAIEYLAQRWDLLAPHIKEAIMTLASVDSA